MPKITKKSAAVVESTPVAKKVSTKKATPKKKVAKKATKKTSEKTAPKEAKAAKVKSGQSGVARDHDVAWTEVKKQVFQAMKQLHATSAGDARSAIDIAEKAKTYPARVRHYCYHARAAGLTEIAQREDIRGYAFYLTTKGAKVDLAKVV